MKLHNSLAKIIMTNSMKTVSLKVNFAGPVQKSSLAGPAQASPGRPGLAQTGHGRPGPAEASKNLKITLAWPGRGRPRPVNNSKWRFPLALAGPGQPCPASAGLVQPGPINASFQGISTQAQFGKGQPGHSMLCFLEILTGLIKPCPSKANL